MNVKVGFIGGGNMAEAFINCLVNKETVIPANIHVSDINEEKLNYLENNYGITPHKSNISVVLNSDLIFLAVKPQVMPIVLKEIADSVSQGQILISMAAGYPIKKIEEILGDDKKLVRIMPNILVKIGKGVIALTQNFRLTPEEEELVEKLLSNCGTIVKTEEKNFDAVTALSGSGPAFIFLTIEALSDAGVKIGLSRDTALKLILETIIGSTEMVKKGEHPEVLKDKVTSPAGTTIAGLSALEEKGTRYAFIKAVEEAFKRSKEISQIIEKL